MLVYLCFILTPIAATFAADWHDDFTAPAEKEAAWQQEGNESAWTFEDGVLNAETRPKKLFGTLVEHLRFAALPRALRGIHCHSPQCWRGKRALRHRARKTLWKRRNGRYGILPLFYQ